MIQRIHHSWKLLAAATVLAVAATLIVCGGARAEVSAPRAPDRLAAAENELENWLTHGRSYAEQRFSPLKQIDVDTVKDLGLAWYVDFDTARGQETTPLVVDGVVFATSAWSKVYALDAATGRLLWTFDPKVPAETAVKACCDVVNRGVAYCDLRWSAITRDKTAWRAIVHDGVLSSRGMVSFSGELDEDEMEAVRAYVTQRASDDSRAGVR